MIKELLDLLQQAAPCYFVTYEEAHMMNLTADQLATHKGFVYVEEYRNGSYDAAPKYGNCTKTTKLDVYFCKFAPLHADALKREDLRAFIEGEAVLPFVELLQQQHQVRTITWTCPVPRFDANEVSICLSFTITEEIC